MDLEFCLSNTLSLFSSCFTATAGTIFRREPAVIVRLHESAVSRCVRMRIIVPRSHVGKSEEVTNGHNSRHSICWCERGHRIYPQYRKRPKRGVGCGDWRYLCISSRKEMAARVRSGNNLRDAATVYPLFSNLYQISSFVELLLNLRRRFTKLKLSSLERSLQFGADSLLLDAARCCYSIYIFFVMLSFFFLLLNLSILFCCCCCRRSWLRC